MVQFAAVVVMALLAGLPAAQVLTCPLRAEAAAAACPMGMSEASANCPMAPGMIANECLRDCCNCGLQKLSGPATVRVHPKPAVPVQFRALAELTAESDRAAWAAKDVPVPSSSPPKYILHRVFRI